MDDIFLVILKYEPYEQNKPKRPKLWRTTKNKQNYYGKPPKTNQIIAKPLKTSQII